MSNLVPTSQEFATMKELGLMAIKSGFLPESIRTPEQAVVIMLKGREIGIGPMEAFSKISVIKGKPTMDAELMLSQIYKKIPGAIVNFIKTTNEVCEIEAQRPKGKPTTFTFTIEDAQRAKLTSKQNWQTFPAAMLRARCISAMARAVFPDALGGVSYTPEELGAETDDEGNVVAEPKDEPRDVSPEQPLISGEDDPRAYVIEGGAMVNRTLGEVLDEKGLPATQDYVNKLEKFCEKEGKPLFTWARFLKVNLGRYERSMMNGGKP